MPQNSLNLGSLLEPFPGPSDPNFSSLGAQLLRIDPALWQQALNYRVPAPSAQAAPIPTTPATAPGLPTGTGTSEKGTDGRRR